MQHATEVTHAIYVVNNSMTVFLMALINFLLAFIEHYSSILLQQEVNDCSDQIELMTASATSVARTIC